MDAAFSGYKSIIDYKKEVRENSAFFFGGPSTIEESPIERYK